jgi:hypothetical protein
MNPHLLQRRHGESFHKRQAKSIALSNLLTAFPRFLSSLWLITEHASKSVACFHLQEEIHSLRGLYDTIYLLTAIG